MTAPSRNPARPSAARAFTLLELVVVVLVVGILGAMIVPQLTGNNQRIFRATVDKVGDLLTMYGQRQNLGQKIVGITHNRMDNSIALLEIVGGSDGGYSEWVPDAYVRPVRLPSFMTDTDIDFVVDGDLYDPSQWPLSSEPGQQRPTIEIHMRGPDGAHASLILAPHGVAPTVAYGVHSSGLVREAIDLDTAGMGREDW